MCSLYRAKSDRAIRGTQLPIEEVCSRRTQPGHSSDANANTSVGWTTPNYRLPISTLRIAPCTHEQSVTEFTAVGEISREVSFSDDARIPML